VLIDFGLHGGALDGPNAHETPAGGGHGFDQQALGRGLRIELGKEAVEEFGEYFG
jgi:hypothetical protein